MLRKLINLFPHEDIGWKEIGETFVRYTLLKTPLFRVYLHELVAPVAHPQCHDHPWSFVTILLKGGYIEDSGYGWIERRPGDILFRSATHSHNVVTQDGVTSWSLVFTTRKVRQWGFNDCHG